MKIVDVNTLEPPKDSYINKKEGYLYFLFDHKSYEDKGVTFQLLTYMVEIWETKMNKEKSKELPIIIPLVIHHGRLNWRIPSNLGAMLDGLEELSEELKTYVPNFEYLLYDLTIYDDEDIKGNAQTRIWMTLFRDLYTKDPNGLLESIFRSIHYLIELEDKQTGLEYFETMMRYIFSAAKDLTQKDVDQIIQRFGTTYPEGSEIAMTLADMWRDEGIQQGMQQGVQQGLQQGLEIGGAKVLAKTAIQLLTEKFGKIPEEIKTDLSKLDTVSLELLLINIFKYENIDDVRKYIQ